MGKILPFRYALAMFLYLSLDRRYEIKQKVSDRGLLPKIKKKNLTIDMVLILYDTTRFFSRLQIHRYVMPSQVLP